MENLTESPVQAQRKTAEVLVTLLAAPLPPASWTIYAAGAAELTGLLEGDDPRAMVAVWAAHLGTTVVEERSGYDGVLRGYVRATADGVRVRVWAVIEDAPDAAAS